MGDEGDDILRSFKLSVEDAKNYDTVVGKFERHFVRRRNVIYERAKFNQRRQEPGEPVDTFITALYSLAEHCGYAAMQSGRQRNRKYIIRVHFYLQCNFCSRVCGHELLYLIIYSHVIFFSYINCNLK